MRRKLDIYLDFLQQVWRDGHVDRIPQFMEPNTVCLGLFSETEVSPADLRELVPALHMHVDKLHHEVVLHGEYDDILHVVLRVTGKSRAHAAPIAFTGQTLLRFSGEKFTQVYDHYDLITLFAQLGFLPHETIELCLSGETLS